MSLPAIHHPELILSPSLVVFRDRVRQNLQAMVNIAGEVSRLRPHCKTHKMAAVTKLQLAMGIHKFKAATLAEAEMLAHSGATDVVLAYPVVGPNIRRVIEYRQKFPDVKFAVCADDSENIQQLGQAADAAGTTFGVALDINPGRDRTGVRIGDHAAKLYRQVAETHGLWGAGLHFYDGHLTQSDPVERRQIVEEGWFKLIRFRDDLEAAGLNVPSLICGGTPTFPIYAKLKDPALELSPGTCVFHDAGYAERFPDLHDFIPAAFVFTRVISRPAQDRVTFDVGTKAVASDPPAGSRVVLPEIPDAVQVLQNEEHLVIETAHADRFRPGDWTLAIPRHVCPTSALHASAIVLEEGEQVDEWKVTSRDRQLSI